MPVAALHGGVALLPITITSSATFSVVENSTAVATLTATGGLGSFTWSKIGGADTGKFTLTSGGVLSFTSAPDYEVPTDANTDNVYLVQVQAADGVSAPATQNVSVTVTDVADTDPSFSSVVFLSGFEGADASTAMVDEATGKAVTPVGNAQIDTAQFRFGASSLLLNGTNSYLTLVDHASFTLSSQFTFECWVRFNSVGADQNFITKYGPTVGASEWAFSRDASGRLSFIYYETPASLKLTAFTWTPVVNTWYHIAADRDAAGNVRLYVNGAMLGKVNFAAAAMQNTTEEVRIGARRHTSAGYLNGWLDEVRITNGVARYASDAGYTVPTAAFPRS